MQKFTKEELDKIAEYKQLVKLYKYNPSEIVHELNMCISDARYEAFKGCLLCLTIYLMLEILIIAIDVGLSKIGMIVGAIAVVILYWLNPRSRIDWRYFKAVKSVLLITLANFETVIKRKVSLDDPIVMKFYEGLMIQGLMAEDEAKMHRDEIHYKIRDLYSYMLYKIFLMSLDEEGEET